MPATTSTRPPPRAAPADASEAATARQYWMPLTLVLFAALTARTLLTHDYIVHNPLAAAPLNDAEHYWNWAGRIAAGQWSEPEPFFSSPLYPYLLGVFRATGGTLPVLYVFQMFADLLTALLLARLARHYGGARAGVLAAALFLVLLEPASAALRVLTTTLQIFLVVLTWTSVLYAQRRGTIRAHALLGVAFGLMCLADGTAVLILVLMVAWLVWNAPRGDGGWWAHLRRHAWRAALPAGVTLLFIAPATIHNWRASGGEFFLVRSGSGMALIQGNQPQSQGAYTPVEGIGPLRATMYANARRVYEQKTGQAATWGAVDRYFRDQALHFWVEQPGRAISIVLRKVYLFWTARNYGDIYQPPAEIASGQNPWLRVAPLPTPWLLFPALLGIGLLVRRRASAAPAIAFFAVPLVIVAIFLFSPRYRAPALPVVAVAAALALAEAVRLRRNVGFAAMAGIVLLLGPLSGVANWAQGLDPVDMSSAHFNRGSALATLNQADEAFAEWREGLRIKDSVEDRFTLADALARYGR